MKSMNKDEYLELIKEFNILNEFINNKNKNDTIDFLAEYKYDIVTKEEAKIRVNLLNFIIENTKTIYEKKI